MDGYSTRRIVIGTEATLIPEKKRAIPELTHEWKSVQHFYTKIGLNNQPCSTGTGRSHILTLINGKQVEVYHNFLFLGG